MNSNSGQLYDSYESAVADLKPHESESDIVQVIGTRFAAERMSRSIQQAKAIERRRAANKRARRARRRP